MVKSKKLLSLFLAVVMVLSVFTVMASAYTVGPEVAGNINYKYTVEKVNTVPETSDSPEYTANNIYAVTAWLQCDAPVYTAIIPVHFNTEKFSPIMLFDGEVTYPAGAGFGVDDYYEKMGEGTVYAYKLGDYMNNTGMYKANGTTATTKALAKCIGLGNANTSAVKAGLSAQLVSPGNPLYNKWNAGLPANTGIMYAQMDIASVEKTAYYNTIDGVTTETGWVRMITFYFETLAGVTDADVVGEEFGVYTDNCFTVDGDVDASGYGYFAGATTAKYGTNPEKNVVSNAVIEGEVAESSPVYKKSSQIRYNSAETNGEGSANFDVRTRAAMTAADFAKYCTYNAETKETNITKVGFVYADSSVGLTLDNAAKVIGGTAVAGYVDVPVEHIQLKDGEYIWTCLITDADYNDAVDSVGYIVAGGKTFYFDAVSATDFSTLYDAQSSHLPTA